MSEGKKQILWKFKKKNSHQVYPNISPTILKAWIIEGRIQRDDFLCNSEQTEWQPANQFSELSELLGNSSESLPEIVKQKKTNETISHNDLGFSWASPKMEDVEMDMTPMMDCVFLLLIFFVVSATFAIHEVKNIQVPKANYTVPTKQEKVTLTVAIDKDRQIYLGKTLVALSNLRTQLIAEVNKTSQQDVILTADHSLDYGFIVSILDEINAAGIKNVKLKLEKKQKP